MNCFGRPFKTIQKKIDPKTKDILVKIRKYLPEKTPSIFEFTLPGDSPGYIQFFSDEEEFRHCYYIHERKKKYFRYVHELQNIMDNYGIS